MPPPERIATFDNDGTLWSEKPVPFQVMFAFDRVKALAPQPSRMEDAGAVRLAAQGRHGWRGRDRGKGRARDHGRDTHRHDDRRVLGHGARMDRHARGIRQRGRLFTEMVYQPMLELLAYLRANGFKTFIVSGGGVEFMRPWAERVYGIPPEQVVGSSGKLKLEVRNGTPVLVKLPEVDLIDDKEGKPVGIQRQIGRRPIAAFGNSDGDLQMLEWAMAGPGARFALFVHHDDAAREFAYDRADKLQQFDKGWDEAVAKGWTVVSMKDDWKTVYPPAQSAGGPR